MYLNRLNLLSGYRYPFDRFASLPPVNLFLFSLSFPLLHFRLSFKSFIIFAIAFHSVGWDRSQVQRRISWFEIREIMNNPREIKAEWTIPHPFYYVSFMFSYSFTLWYFFLSTRPFSLALLLATFRRAVPLRTAYKICTILLPAALSSPPNWISQKMAANRFPLALHVSFSYTQVH